jgi:AcrR family transcriptional regulator
MPVSQKQGSNAKGDSEGFRENRQREIIEVSVRLFAKSGFHGVGIDAIGQAAGMTGPGVYSHFRNKDEILVRIFATALSTMCASAGRIMALPDNLERLRELVRFHLDFVLRDLNLSHVYVTERRNLPSAAWPAIRELQRDYISAWTTSINQVRPNLSVEHGRTLAESMIGMVNSLAFYRPWLSESGRRAFVEDIIMAAIMNARGSAE